MDPGHRLVSVQLTEAIEALDPQHECSEYWAGKADNHKCSSSSWLPPWEAPVINAEKHRPVFTPSVPTSNGF